MNDDPESSQQKSWFERLSRLLLREPKDQEQLIELLKDAQQRQLIDLEAFNMIEKIILVSQRQVRDAMIPRPHMITVSGQLTPQEVLPQVIEAGHSRFPVIGKNEEEILGILLAKDLLPCLAVINSKITRVQQLIRPAIFIPESKRLNILLKEFRLNRNHMAIVVDEYGHISGLITIEDILEEIVGEIEDEYDIENEVQIQQVQENEYTVNALTPIEEFNRHFSTHFSHEDIDTIGGLVLKKLSHLPKRGESIILEPLKIVVLEASKRGIQLLKVFILESERNSINKEKP